ncbi:MAG: amylo-alpha-1,6-glucosidase [bacterium]
MDLERAEWLETDGLGGFASGTAAGIRTRRYHALLLAAAKPPAERMVLVNGMDVAVDVGAGWVPASTQAYRGGVRHPEGFTRLESFERRPWPTWRHRVGDGLFLEQELFMAHGDPATLIRFRLLAEGREAKAAAKQAKLVVRPFLSGRDYHALHQENRHFRWAGAVGPGRVTWQPYEGVPGIEARHDGEWVPEPLWYRRFSYAEELGRGLEDGEDLASPGYFRFSLAKGEAVLIWRALVGLEGTDGDDEPAAVTFRRVATRERKHREKLGSPLEAAARAYLVSRGNGRTILAGYPWFTDWGRDTFVALRGLCLATGRLADALSILSEWAGAVSEGLVPSRFPDHGGAPEYESADASLWYVVAVGETLAALARAEKKVAPRVRAQLVAAVQEILGSYAKGTRLDIRADADGLLAAGIPGQPVTWMDARVGERGVTPRAGKPVEIQALWINALGVGARLGDARWAATRERARNSFASKFWNAELGGLHDVVDVDHVAGAVDASVRPNQIFAVGGLPEAVLEGKKAHSVVDVVEDRLLTPLGLRTLAPDEPGYSPRYEGSPAQRDAAYHQGTVWPWLLGPFVEAWVRVHGGERAAILEARSRFLPPLEKHLEEAGLGHVSEILDGGPPHVPRGCPFQAWSVGEALRLDKVVLAVPAGDAEKPRRRADARPAVKARRR